MPDPYDGFDDTDDNPCAKTANDLWAGGYTDRKRTLEEIERAKKNDNKKQRAV